MDPEQAIAQIVSVVKKLFPLVSDKTRMDFVYALTGDADSDRSDLVHL